MTIPPLLVVIIIAIVMSLLLACFGLALGWRRAEAEINLMRKQRAFRAIGGMAIGEKHNG